MAEVCFGSEFSRFVLRHAERCSLLSACVAAFRKDKLHKVVTGYAEGRRDGHESRGLGSFPSSVDGSIFGFDYRIYSLIHDCYRDALTHDSTNLLSSSAGHWAFPRFNCGGLEGQCCRKVAPSVGLIQWIQPQPSCCYCHVYPIFNFFVHQDTVVELRSHGLSRRRPTFLLCGVDRTTSL